MVVSFLMLSSCAGTREATTPWIPTPFDWFERIPANGYDAHRRCSGTRTSTTTRRTSRVFGSTAVALVLIWQISEVTSMGQCTTLGTAML